MASNEWKDGGYSGSPGLQGLQGLSPYALDPAYLPKAPEFIFPVATRQRSWNEKCFDRVGTSYLLGHALGGVWGIQEGLRNKDATTRRMKVNALLNGLTRRGPFLANTLAVVTLVYSPTESLLGHLRGTQDPLNSFAAAGIAGVLYKSTAGPRPMMVAALAGLCIVGVAHLLKLNDIKVMEYV